MHRDAAKQRPFCAYVSFTQFHPPVHFHPDSRGKSGGGKGSAMLAEIDYRSDQILDVLAKAGIAEDTIVVWSSDHATAHAAGVAGSNGPWRGVFGSGFEGGFRAPALVRWPGEVPAGAVSSEILATSDWMPTLAALIRQQDRVPANRPIDGADASELLLGRSETPTGTLSSVSALTVR